MRSALLSRLAALPPSARCIGGAALLTAFVFLVPWTVLGLWIFDAFGWLTFTAAQWLSAHARLSLAVGLFLTLALFCLWVSDAWGVGTRCQSISDLALLVWIVLIVSAGLAHVGDGAHHERVGSPIAIIPV